MNYYLTPQPIAEELNLAYIRKSTAGGLYLLSEYDLLPYGIDKAVEEGAIPLSDNLPPLPAGDEQQAEQPAETVSGQDKDARTDEEASAGQEEPGRESPREEAAGVAAGIKQESETDKTEE